MGMGLDEEDIIDLQRLAFFNKFNIARKVYEYQNKPNGTIETSTDTVAFYDTEEDGTKVVEMFDLKRFWGLASVQLRSNEKRTMIVFRSFPDGEANFNRCVVIDAAKMGEEYLINTTVANNFDLVDISNIRQKTVKSFDYSVAMTCLLSIKDELDTNSLDLFVDYLNLLAPNFHMPVIPSIPIESGRPKLLEY